MLHRVDRPVPKPIVDAMNGQHQFLPINAAIRSARDQVELPLRLRQYRIDLFHAPYFAVSLQPRTPYVVSLHDSIPVLYPAYWSPFEGAVIREWQRHMVRGASQVITGSYAAQDDIVRLYAFDRRRIAVTPWGPIDLDATAETPEARPNEPYFLCVCTNKPHKNLTRLIEAYGAAMRRASSLPNLVIAGGWSDRFPEPKVAAAQSSALEERITFIHGPSDGVLRYLYQHAVAFVYPSLYEGFGLPVLEAMQAGLPIAASTTPAVAEVAGDAALPFDPTHVEAIADAIVSLANDSPLRDRLRSAAARRLAAFNWSTTTRETLNAYDMALGANTAAPAHQEVESIER
jgi:glycosyltransferase involved in cell wall biosynthesis